MTGLEDFNHAAFVKAGVLLKDEFDLAVHNPAKSFGSRKDLDPKQYLRHCQHMISESVAIIFLPGWTYSKGCTEEAYMAQALGLPRYTLVGSDLILDEDPLPTIAERKVNISDWIDQVLEDEGVKLKVLPGMRSAEVGIVYRGNTPIGIAYDEDRCIDATAEMYKAEDGEPETEGEVQDRYDMARDNFSFNTVREIAYSPSVPGLPLFLATPSPWDL